MTAHHTNLVVVCAVNHFVLPIRVQISNDGSRQAFVVTGTKRFNGFHLYRGRSLPWEVLILVEGLVSENTKSRKDFDVS